MSTKAELADVQVGDRLWVMDQWTSGQAQEATVCRRTAKQIIVKLGPTELKFDLAGRQIGGSTRNNRKRYFAVSAETRRRGVLLSRLNKLHWGTWPQLSTGQLERIVAILDESGALAL